MGWMKFLQIFYREKTFVGMKILTGLLFDELKVVLKNLKLGA
jgi:hypothetical protein